MIKKEGILTERHIVQPYLVGTMLAINAIRNSYILVDAPNCIYKRAEYIKINHDFYCDLFDPDGFHRVSHTDATVDAIIDDRTDLIEKHLYMLARYPKAQAVFLSSLPSSSLTGIHYDLIIHKVQQHIQKPIIEIPANNLSQDWMGGYADVLYSMACALPFKNKKKKASAVAIVGYFFDRHEGDHVANIKELKRLLKALSLTVVSVWLEGQSFSQLQKVEDAALIISLPYARKAAKEIAKKTGAQLIETDIPFGLDNTTKWLTTIAVAMKKQNKLAAVIDQELNVVAPVMQFVIPRFITNKNFSICGDPYLVKQLISALQECGAQIPAVVVVGSMEMKVRAELKDIEIMECPFFKEVESSSFLASEVIIGNSLGKYFARSSEKKPGKQYIEFGFPSVGYHCFSESPFMGYRGFLNFLNRIVNQINSGSIIGLIQHKDV